MNKVDSNNPYKNLVSKIYNLKKNDIVNITSDITLLLIYFKKNKQTFDGNKFIDAIIEKVGPNGTVLFPAFNWDFCNKKKFDYLNSPPQTGSLPNIVFKRKDFKRTRHPIYSFFVWGKDKNYLCNLRNKSGWGENSPFSYFYQKNAKNLFVGLDCKDGFTFMHHPEEKLGTKFRFFKDFSAPYVDEKNNEKIVTYTMHVRDLEKSNSCHVDPRFIKALADNKAYSKYKIFDTNFTIVEMKLAGDLIENEMKLNKSFLIYNIIK